MSIRLLIGDCRERLRDLPDRSVHCVVTSPPYFGLRDYGTVDWQGGDPSHEHDKVPARNGRGGSAAPGKQTQDAFPSDLPASVCSCGAVKVDNQIGLEPTPDEFVAALVEVFRSIRRVLRDDGTVWLNLGDSYSGSGKGPGNINLVSQMSHTESTKIVPYGCKPKDLIGIPWMVAFALRADGWYLRQEIIWAKPNPMPESVLDRCTKAHEQIFLLAKSGKPTIWRHESGIWSNQRPPPDYCWRNSETGEDLPFETDPAPPHGKGDPWRRANRWSGRDYFYDGDAIAEDSVTGDLRRPYGSEGAWEMDGRPEEQRKGGKPRGPGNKAHRGADLYGAGDEHHRTKGGLVAYARRIKAPSGWDTSQGEGRHGEIHREGRSNTGKTWAERKAEGEPMRHGIDGAGALGVGNFATGEKRNKRSVWTVSTQPFAEAHFATYPPALIEDCIKAGSPERCCSACGSPIMRMTIREQQQPRASRGSDPSSHRTVDNPPQRSGVGVTVETIGWMPACDCNAESRPGVVLDPFGGAGTTGLVADRLHRDAVMIELNPDYAALSRRRIEREAGMFSQIQVG